MMMSRNWTTSKYYGMEPEEIKSSWDENAKQAAELGTQLHKSIEKFYIRQPPGCGLGSVGGIFRTGPGGAQLEFQ